MNDIIQGNYCGLIYDGAAFRLRERIVTAPGWGLASTPTVNGASLSINPSVVQTKAATQAGQEIICNAAGSASAQTCALTPTLMVYTAGMRILFRAAATNAGPLSLDIDGFGAKSVKKADGQELSGVCQ